MPTVSYVKTFMLPKTQRHRPAPAAPVTHVFVVNLKPQNEKPQIPIERLVVRGQ